MVDLDDMIRQLTDNAQAIRAFLERVPDEQARWHPGPDRWSLMEVMEHIYNEERLDFRKHLKEMFHEPPQPWGRSQPEDWLRLESCRQALEGFLAEREDSIAWLRGLESPNWDAFSQATFGPDHEVITMRAGDVLYSWVEHDFLHLRQINETLHYWNAHQARPYSVDYGGGW